MILAIAFVSFLLGFAAGGYWIYRLWHAEMNQ